METLLAPTQERWGLSLPQAIALDGVICLAMGLLLVLGATPLAQLFALPEALLLYAGVVLFPCATLMFFTARRPAVPLIWLVIGGNAVWVAASAGVAFWFQLTGIGLAFLVAQGAVVVVLLVLEVRALSR